MFGGLVAKLTVVIVPLVLAGSCAAPPGQRAEGTALPELAQQAPGCVVTTKADVPFTFEQDHLLIPAMINGQPVRLELDTGLSAALALDRSPATVRRLELPVRPSNEFVILVDGATQRQDLAAVGELRIGDAALAEFDALVPSSASGFNERAIGDGVVGTGFLGRYDIEIDPRSSRLRLHEVSGCGDVLVPFDEPFDIIPIRRGNFGLLYAPVELDGRRLYAMLDTGANVTVLSRNGALKAGVTAADLASDPFIPEAFINAVGDACGVCIHQFDEFVIGNIYYSSVSLPITETEGPFDMAIGTDLLLEQRVLISPATAKLYFSRYPSGR